NCVEEPDTGYCRALFYNWYFDQQTGTCREFVYGGCGGNGNRYWSEEECLENCGGGLYEIIKEIPLILKTFKII
ncbi:unnamed protein product, partial [Larinioides sclopetarius]